MFESLADQRERELRALDAEMAVQGLGLYGLAEGMAAITVPDLVAWPLACGLAGAGIYRWLTRRMELGALVPPRARRASR